MHLLQPLRAATLALGLAGLLLAAPAAALPNYPGDLDSQLALCQTPGCNLCHATATGGGARVTPFGISFEAASGSVSSRVMQLEADGTDSDGDGTGDIAELRACTDPNGVGALDDDVPEYGCGARVESQGPLDVGGVLAALSCVGLLVAARRRRRG